MNSFAIVGIIISFSSTMLGLYGIISGKKKEHYIWSAFSLSVALWGFGIYKIATTVDQFDAIFWWKLAEVGVILIPVFFFHFIVEHLSFNRQKPILGLVYITGAVFLLINIFTDYYVTGVRFAFDSFYYIEKSSVFTAFIVFFILISAYSILLLYKKYSNSTDISEKKRIKSLFGIFSTAFIGGCSSYLPVYGLEVLPLANIFIFICVLAIFYLIFWQKFLNAKNIVSQVITLLIWIVLAVRIFISQSTSEMLFDVGIFLMAVMLGTFLIRSVIKEVDQRERIEKLATDLQKANDRLTELDRQKSEFVSFATHQLRAPLTAMKGYASLILEGDVGEVNGEVRNAVSRIFDSSKTLASIVDDYLNITRIELGTMKYAFDTVDLKMMVADVIAELKPNIDESKATFTFAPQNHDTDYRITADRDKLKQVIANLIDNSVKYTPTGKIQVSISRNVEKNKIVFEVKDTGIGIAPEIMPHLFAKFSRAGNANKTNIKGTGLGLFVAKEIINSHHGVIYAESEGEGKGSRFVVELEPLWKAQ